MALLGSKNLWPKLRLGLVLLTWGFVTWNYYLFSHFLHNFSFHRMMPDHDGGTNHSSSWDHQDDGNGGKNHSSYDHHGNGGGDERHEHGRRGSFERIHDRWDWLFLYGLALPLVLLTLAAVVWNPSTSTGSAKDTDTCTKNSQGEVNVRKWTIILFVVPMYLVMWDAARAHHAQEKKMGWDLYVAICMSLLSPSGYAATWALSLFLIPVTKHSPILDWLRVTPVQALAFHRITGWLGFWNSVLHGFVHLRHLMDVLNPQRLRSWHEQLRILLIPSSWQCIATQDPFGVFFLGKNQHPLHDDAEGQQCWLALVNATGMISVIAYMLLAITSLPRVRRCSYKLFYLVHIPAAWIMLITAIWHYPTCALILIPNIIYYLSFHIPVWVTQAFGHRKLQSSGTDTKKISSLVEANLIPGGAVELVLSPSREDRRRYENLFVKVSHPSVSPLTHPFSVFSRRALMVDADNEDDDETLAILFRPAGPFTEGLTKELFPNHNAGDDDDNTNLDEALLLSSSSHHMLQFDVYYAGSFDWIDHAMLSHDEILLAAGGVGVVPFLEFLPLLNRRIQADTTAAETGVNEGYVPVALNSDEEVSSKSNSRFLGPKCIHFHWFCREVGVASYIWYTYLRHHVNAWENNETCQGRLKIHLHLTAEGVGGEDLTTVPNLGLVKKNAYSVPVAAGQQQCVIRPVKDAQFTQSWKLGLLLHGSLMVIGTMLHWWWYKQVILSDGFRDDNLILRSHSIVFTLLLAMVGSVLLECWLKRRRDAVGSRTQPTEHAEVLPSEAATTAAGATGLEDEMEAMGESLVLSKGRPSLDVVIEPVLKAERPGVYSCGSHSFMEAIEGSIRRKRKDCAFYREDPEM